MSRRAVRCDQSTAAIQRIRSNDDPLPTLLSQKLVDIIVAAINIIVIIVIIVLTAAMVTAKVK